ncbi:tetratricopeptide repeat protein [Leptospira santarosai str. CBC1416]|uniref:Tetratricopeptide repeat protein n=1 Tax=Leptospira santarosai str. CBC1416 TaxID=1193059 RepID=M6VU98_9LEPT|nr:tetratricopeptide repeat protein [Leptospira santarosai str. CBC1416]
MYKLEKMPTGDWLILESQEVIEFTEIMDEALELWESNQVKKFEKVIRGIILRCPYHIDALHHLSLILHERKQYFEEYLIEKEAIGVILSLMNGIFDFKKDKLIYAYLENRPFHRAYYSFGLCLYRMNRISEAIEVFENMIQINPGDNMGVRCLLTKYYFETNQPEKVILLSEQYSDDTMVDIVYGKVLAKFYLGKGDFKDDLRSAIRFLPKVGKEIIKMLHTKPSQKFLGKTQVMTVGGEDEAYYYWENYGIFWLQAIDLHEHLKEIILDLKLTQRHGI